MNEKPSQGPELKRPGLVVFLLELVTAAVLLLVLAAVGWMVLAAYWPETLRLASLQTEVVVVLLLLTAALLLVTVVALVQTRT